MKLLKLYEGAITESGANHCVADFGKVLFADKLGGNEPDTKHEKKHADAVYNFTDFNFGENMKGKVEDAIFNLQDCMRAFPEVLMPDNELVYRGTSAPIMTFINEGLIPAEAPQPYLYRGKSPIQSWSDDVNTAKIFGDAELLNEIASEYLGREAIMNATLENIIPKLDDVMIPVILEYRATPAEFLFKGKYLNQLSEHPNESEVIRVGDGEIQTLAHLNVKWVGNNARLLIQTINNQL